MIAVEDKQLSREEYFAERRLLLDARQRSFQRAEQMVAGGAAGALLLSITFLKDFAPGPSVQGLWALIAAWTMLLLCLTLSLFSQYFSGQAFDREIANMEHAFDNGDVPQQGNPWATANRWCCGVASLFLIVGIVLFAGFAYVNAPFQRS